MQIGITNVVSILKFNVHVSHGAVVRASRYPPGKAIELQHTYYGISSVFGGVSEEIGWQSMWSGEENL